METLKKLWAPIAGFIGAVTLVVEFIQLWKGDQADVTYAFTGLSIALIIFGLLWVGLSRKTYEVPDFIEFGKTKVKKDWQYAKNFRYLAFAGLLVCFLGGCVGAIALILRRQALEAKTVILVARFDGPEDKYAVRDELLEQLRSATRDYQDIEIMPRPESVTVEQGGDYARRLGKRYQADIVIWGWYRETDNPNVTLHVENLDPTEIILVSTNDPIRPNATIFDLKSFELQQGLGKDMSAMVLFISGYAHYIDGDYRGALTRFERAIAPSEWSDNPINRADALYYKAETYFFLNRYEDAIADYNEAIQLNPKHSLSYLNRGVVYATNEEHEKAIADYIEGMRLKPLEPELAADVYTNMGVAYFSLGKSEEAIKNYTQATQLDPNDFLAFFNRCIAYKDIGQEKEAIADCDRAIELDPDDPDTYINRGVAYDDLGSYKEAIADYGKAIELDPNSALAYYNRGNTYFSLGQYADSITDYTQAIKFDPEDPAAYRNRGDAYTYLQQYELAIADYSSALKLDPEVAITYFKRGDRYLDLGKYEEAIKDYDNGIQRDDRDVDAYYNRGVAYFSLGQYEKALADFTRALELNPKEVDAYYNRGSTYVTLGQYEDAIADFTMVINLDAQNELAYYNRAILYLGTNRKDLAVIDLQKCIEIAIDPSVKQAAEAKLQKINNP